MQIVNLPTVTVTTGGTEILSSAAATAAVARGINALVINPDVDIVLVDPSDGSSYADIPGATAGSVANSPLVCSAGTPTVVLHRSGAVKAISTSGNATVKVALGCAP